MPDLAPTVTLSRGAEMPRLGLGTWPLDDAAAADAVAGAIGLGYRSIDTAYAYGNERGVGEGLRRSGVPREELFVVSKLNARWHGVEEVKEAFAMATDKLGTDYLDLFLIHWPNPDQDRYVEAYRGLIALHEAGLVRGVGVSNFKPAHLERVIAETGQAPDLDQIELDPTLTRTEARAFHAEHGIITESWSPLGQGSGVIDEPAIVEIAEARGRTPAQIVLRWHMELGCVTVPKSADPERQATNLDIFDFALTEDEVRAISALDRGEAAAEDSDVSGH